MEHNLNIIIIEDDTQTCQRFVECVESTDEISIVSITNNSYRALELVEEYLPDVIILDLELNDGKGNGMLFLEGLKNADIPFKPFILVTTNNSSNMVYHYARQLGADFIMSKHQEDYSESKAIEFLKMMKSIIQGNIQKQHIEYSTTETPQDHNNRLMRLITIELNNIGISPKAIGYEYLSEAILLVMNGQTKHLSSKIAQNHKKTDTSVERAMQNAINKAWSSNDIDELLKHYTAKISSEKGVPTLTEFIYYYARKIMNNS